MSGKAVNDEQEGRNLEYFWVRLFQGCSHTVMWEDVGAQTKIK